jgi:hypothetical protein
MEINILSFSICFLIRCLTNSKNLLWSCYWLSVSLKGWCKHSHVAGCDEMGNSSLFPSKWFQWWPLKNCIIEILVVYCFKQAGFEMDEIKILLKQKRVFPDLLPCSHLHNYDYYNLAITELLKWIVLKLRTIITTIFWIKNQTQRFHQWDLSATLASLNSNTGRWKGQTQQLYILNSCLTQQETLL